MQTGEQLALGAMKKEFKVLSKKADRAKAEADECLNVGTELIAIHEEFAEIVKSKEHGQSVINKVDRLKKRSEKAEKIRKKDLLKLLDKENNTRFTRDSLGHEIQNMEFRLSLRKAE